MLEHVYRSCCFFQYNTNVIVTNGMIQSSFSLPGPSYVTIKVRLPYKNFALPSSHTRSEDLDTSTTSMPLSIEEGKEKPQQGEIIYPSLPNVGDYESPGAGYGRQQEQDIFSGHSSEQSKLLRT